jgi:hypothetical protein
MPLLDHLVGAAGQGQWDGDAERLCGFEIDDLLDFSCLLDRQISRFCTFGNTSGLPPHESAAAEARRARRAPQRGVHPDHVAGEIEGRSARASLVGGRVDLNEIVVRAVPDVAAAARISPTHAVAMVLFIVALLDRSTG